MHSRIKQLAYSGVFAAVIFVATAYTHIPIGFNQAYIHIGDVFIYLAASVLSPWYAAMAASIGSGLADAMVAPIYILPTVIIKAVMSLMFTSRRKMLCARNVSGVFTAGFICTAGYYLADVWLYGSWVSPLAAILPGLVQPVLSGLIFILIAVFLDRRKSGSIQ